MLSKDRGKPANPETAPFFFYSSMGYLAGYNGQIPSFIPIDLQQACITGNTATLSALLPKDRPQTPDDDEETIAILLEVAVHHNQPGATGYLLTLQPTDSQISSDLVFVALDKLETYRVLFAHQPSILEYNWERLGNAVMMAVSTHNLELLDFALTHGADPGRNPATYDAEWHWIERLPLDMAILRNRRDVVELLLAHGASVRGTEALQAAARWGHVDLLEVLLDAEAELDGVLEEELRWGYDYIDEIFGTALHEAVRRGRRDAVEFLLDRGASVSVRDSKGVTALERAREGMDRDVVALLRASHL